MTVVSSSRRSGDRFVAGLYDDNNDSKNNGKIHPRNGHKRSAIKNSGSRLVRWRGAFGWFDGEGDLEINSRLVHTIIYNDLPHLLCLTLFLCQSSSIQYQVMVVNLLVG